MDDDLDDDDWGAPHHEGDATMTQAGGATHAEEDFFTGDQAVADDFGGGFDDGGMGMDMDMGGGDGMDDGIGMQSMEVDEDGTPIPLPANGPHQAFDPRRVPNERELIMAMAEDEGDTMMDYFDRTFLKNWAGPEHWKLRKVVRKGIDDLLQPNSFADLLVV
jgi:condensin complex subunit 2